MSFYYNRDNIFNFQPALRGPAGPAGFPFVQKYNIGDTGPGGGIVFYINPGGFLCGASGNTICHYLEAAPPYWNGFTEDPNVVWSGNINTTVVTGLFIGSGSANTKRAVDQDGTTNRAVTLASSYSNNGKTDWFLPSLDELNIVYFHKNTIGGFHPLDSYWTSSERLSDGVWVQNFNSGFIWNSASKGIINRVRPIRAFSA